MADLYSPGIEINEVDATNVIPPTAGAATGIAAAFQWGPVSKITPISSEQDLVNTFGKPNADTQVNWLTAANYLSYAGNLQVVICNK